MPCPTCGIEHPDGLIACPTPDFTASEPAVAVAGPVDPLLNRTLNEKYELEERLGTGGMASVYRARHRQIDRRVAVKIILPQFVHDESTKERFRREAKTAGHLQHPNAVTVTDFGETDDGYVYLVMDLLEGSTLKAVLSRETPLDIEFAVSIMLQLSSAVAAMHAIPMIHRDLKPANIQIVVRPDVPAHVKLLDFGIAKYAGASPNEKDRLTDPGFPVGTRGYMSPEQRECEALKPASDVYSLGVIFYEMLTGQLPFRGDQPAEVLRPPSEIVAGIPLPLDSVVVHALQKSFADRPADAAAFRHELYEVAERLGMEQSAAASGLTLEALRRVGTESPSGRLVIDPARLRELRAGGGSLAARDGTDTEGTIGHRSSAAVVPVEPVPEKPEFSRVDIGVDGGERKSSRGKKTFGIVVACIALVLIAAEGYFAARYKREADQGRADTEQHRLGETKLSEKNDQLVTDSSQKMKEMQTAIAERTEERDGLQEENAKLTQRLSILDPKNKSLSGKVKEQSDTIKDQNSKINHQNNKISNQTGELNQEKNKVIKQKKKIGDQGVTLKQRGERIKKLEGVLRKHKIPVPK